MIKNHSHRYSDNCTCGSCNGTWLDALLAAVDRSEIKKRKVTVKKHRPCRHKGENLPLRKK
mgnify:CR=1 FL=1